MEVLRHYEGSNYLEWDFDFAYGHQSEANLTESVLKRYLIKVLVVSELKM